MSLDKCKKLLKINYLKLLDLKQKSQEMDLKITWQQIQKVNNYKRDNILLIKMVQLLILLCLV